jgi:GH15 family glucan-1,4-alpha-glucosidase
MTHLGEGRLEWPQMPASSGFPRIADYGFLSDCHTGALVAPDGAVEWLCLPRFDSPSVFGAVLDREAGSFRLGPRMRAPVARRYIPGTNVLESTWATDTGWVVVRDALTFGEWREEASDPHSRPPADEEADHRLVRVARCVQGQVEIELTCDLAADYGRARPQWELKDHHVAETEVDGRRLRFVSNLNLDVEDTALVARHRMEEGEHIYCALSWADDLAVPESVEEADEDITETEEFWRLWLREGHFPDHPWRIHLQRAALVLKGLTYAPTGAVVAALTTSLPESPGGIRNWDYRYSWIRDATFTLWSLHVLGFDWEAADFASFVRDVCTDSSLQIMYGIGGEKDLTESTLDHLSGYEGSKPVRIGNAAYAQRQNDVYGALIDSVYIHTKVAQNLQPRGWRIVSDQIEAAQKVWREPDQGIWESRGEPQHYVTSKLMCWVALDRGSRIARWHGHHDLADEWHDSASEVRNDILTNGVSDRGVFRQHYATDSLDASTLLIPLVRFLPPDDERVRNTVLAIADELTEGGLVLRYKVEETDDGLHGAEGTFTICSFWLVSALSEIGEAERARSLCERLIGLAGPLRLYAEEIEPHSGAHLGNFPQAFTHLALINAVTHVIADEIEERAVPAPTAVFSEMRAQRGAGTRSARGRS